MTADVLRLLQALPGGLRLLTAAQKAATGDKEAIDFLRSDGWVQALDLLAPGAGSTGQELLQQIKDSLYSVRNNFMGAEGQVIEGEFRVVENAPFDPFVRWLKHRRWGAFVILGPKGQGKSTLALRLAEVWHGELGWPVEVVNLYPEDMYDFVEPVSSQKFLKRVAAIMALLNPAEPELPDLEDLPLFADDDVEAYLQRYLKGAQGQTLDPQKLDRALEPFRRRIVVLDEMSLLVGSSGGDKGRLLVRQIMAQARHLEWLIIYIGQLTRMLPQDLLNCEAVFIKRPSGREALTDRQEPLSMDLWRRATEGFETLKGSPFWEHFPDLRAWAYVDCPDTGKGRTFSGMVPFNLPGSTDQERGQRMGNG